MPGTPGRPGRPRLIIPRHLAVNAIVAGGKRRGGTPGAAGATAIDGQEPGPQDRWEFAPNIHHELTMKGGAI